MIPKSARIAMLPRGRIVSDMAIPTASSPNLIKIGRTTDCTAGWYNAIEEYHFNDRVNPNPNGTFDKIVSRNPLVGCSHQLPFSNEGDSGSFVLNQEGELVGIVIGGNAVSNHTFITLIGDIFNDIIHLTGAKAVRLPSTDNHEQI